MMGPILGWSMSVMAAGASIGYACSLNWRLALYYAFASGINATVLWPK